jgi:hypothetical protein
MPDEQPTPEPTPAPEPINVTLKVGGKGKTEDPRLHILLVMACRGCYNLFYDNDTSDTP